MLSYNSYSCITSLVNQSNLHQHDSLEEKVGPNEEMLVEKENFDSNIPIHSYIFLVVLDSEYISDVSDLLSHIACQQHHTSASHHCNK
jgi:hypothetical protein